VFSTHIVFHSGIADRLPFLTVRVGATANAAGDEDIVLTRATEKTGGRGGDAG
jgi:hypothetical protein